MCSFCVEVRRCIWYSFLRTLWLIVYELYYIYDQSNYLAPARSSSTHPRLPPFVATPPPPPSFPPPPSLPLFSACCSRPLSRQSPSPPLLRDVFLTPHLLVGCDPPSTSSPLALRSPRPPSRLSFPPRSLHLASLLGIPLPHQIVELLPPRFLDGPFLRQLTWLSLPAASCLSAVPLSFRSPSAV